MALRDTSDADFAQIDERWPRERSADCGRREQQLDPAAAADAIRCNGSRDGEPLRREACYRPRN